MPGILSIALFLATLTGLVASSHTYVWYRLIQAPQLPAPYASLGSGLFIGMGLSIPLTMVGMRLLGGATWRMWAAVVFFWMGFFFILLNVTAACDLLRLGLRGVHAVWPSILPVGWSQSLQVTRGFAAAVSLLTLLCTISAVTTAWAGPRVERVSVKLARFPKAMGKFTVAQISDLHVAALLRRPYVEKVVQQTMALKPQLIVLTGDLIDGSPTELADDVAPLGELKAPYGVYGITGNHEYYSGADIWMAAFAKLGIKPLRNARASIGDSAASFDLAGINDPAGVAFVADGGPDLAKALAGRDPQRELVLLAHQPKLVDEAVAQGVGLMLSGHTHGGQIFPFGALVRLAQPYLAGLYRRGATQIYVNRGTGYWGPPLRLGVPAEITLLTLEAAP
jgi:predicted MPP superfamily phosphohydrolase